MTGLTKSLEDKYIEEMKKSLMESTGVKLEHYTELVMRSAYANAAMIFREIGWREGDHARRDKIIDALGIFTDEEVE